MTADELRELADTTESLGAESAADYLRACAEALEKGPVAWEHNGFVSANKGRVEHDEMKNRSCGFKAKPIIALYPLAMPAVPDDALRAENERLIAAIKSLVMPAQAHTLRLPEPMTDEEVAALIAETEYLPTDHAVRYLVETGECRVKEVNEYPFHCDDIRTLLDRLKAAEEQNGRLRESLRGLLAVTSSKAPGTGLIVGAEDRHAAAIKQARAALENKHDR